MKKLVHGATLALATIGTAAGAAPISLNAVVTPAGGVYGLYTQGLDAPAIHVSVTPSDGRPYPVHVTLFAVDINGNKVPWTKQIELTPGQNTPTSPLPNGRPAPVPPANSASADVPFTDDLGYYQITARFESPVDNQTATTEIGVIPHWIPGTRPDSFFASNTSGLKTAEEDLLFMQKIGLKVERGHFYPDLARNGVPAVPGSQPVQFDFTRHDAAWAATKAHGLWALPIIGYSVPGALSEIATKLGMYGPPRNNAEFVEAWKEIMSHYPEITTYEFWNEPWIYGWNWAADGATYRKLQVDTLTMAKKLNPNLRLLAGNSASFVEDHIEPYPDCYKGLLDGTTNHPYTYSVGMPNLRAGDQNRYMDQGAIDNRQMGLPFYYLTEGGVSYDLPSPELKQLAIDLKAQTTLVQALDKEDRSPEALAVRQKYAALRKKETELPPGEDNNNNAYDIVQYYLHAALAGCYQGDAQWQIGYGPGWERSNVTFAVMTHFLEDRPIVADIWPENELIWGAVFANPRFVTNAVRALPRASDIGTRWDVPVPASRANDNTKVAVIWSVTGASNDDLDEKGTLTINNAAGLSAYDCTGRTIKAEHGRLTVPFGQAPVYITSDTLDVITLRSRIATAHIERVTPVNMYAFSLTKPVGEAQSLGVRVENQINRPVTGTLTLTVDGRTTPHPTPFTIAAGKLSEVEIPWPMSIKPSPTNQYAVTISAKTDAGPSKVSQIIDAALFVKRTIHSEVDWKGVIPVLLDSDTINHPIDISQYMLNPGMDRPTGTAEQPRIVARVYTAYDDDNVYIMAKVNQDQFTNQAGEPVVKGRTALKVTLPYKSGYPDGLNHIRLTGDSFQFAFGMRDRVPGWGRQMNDPWAWKGQFYDTDYQYIAYPSTDGVQLTRLWDANSTRRSAYQTEVVPGVGPVQGARVSIDRDEATKLTVYNIAIPRSELKLFDPTAGRLRFGFMINNSEKIDDLNWAAAAGVFHYWRCDGSWSPSWMQELPCETFFGIQQ